MPAAIKWTANLEDAICRAIAITPKGLEHICRANPEFPCADKIYEHRHESSEFGEKYTRAKANQVVRLVDEIIEIADDSAKDLIEVEIKGVTVKQLDREHMERVKVRIDSRKWLAGKLAPKLFGDKLEHTGPGGGAIQIVSTIPRPPKDEEG
jgi:hypothetical protein